MPTRGIKQTTHRCREFRRCGFVLCFHPGDAGQPNPKSVRPHCCIFGNIASDSRDSTHTLHARALTGDDELRDAFGALDVAAISLSLASTHVQQHSSMLVDGHLRSPWTTAADSTGMPMDTTRTGSG